MSKPRKTSPVDAASGLVAGGRGGPEDELLDDGQEEVFSRTEVKTGRIEHNVEAGGADEEISRFGRPRA
jgi:hypothetical protein